MWSERERELIQKYSEEIRQEYYERSRVPLLATVQREPDAQAPNFLKLEIPETVYGYSKAPITMID